MPALVSMFVRTENPGSEDLLALARRGNADAFCDLCREYERRLFGQAIALTADTTLAEDLVQETLVEAWKCLARYNGRCRFFTWLCAILLNRFRNSIRRRRPVSFSSLGSSDQGNVEETLDQAVDRQGSPDQALVGKERLELMKQCVETLSARHQEVIYLRFYVDDSLEEIAAALGCSVGTVKSRLFYALDQLRGMPAILTLASSPQEQ